MKAFILFFAVLISANHAFAEEPILATITVKNVLLYEAPVTSSPIVRRVFIGEVLKVTETVKTDKGEIWGKVYLSPEQTGYLQGMYFQNTGTLQQKVWKPEEVLRSKLPFSVAAKGTAELFGPGLQFRYLPLTRFGLVVGAGSVLDGGRSKGFSVAYGLTCILSMRSFTPFFETGTSTLTFNDEHSSLKISTFYINAGVEWISESGYFIGAGISYNRSYNVQVAYDYAYAKEKSGGLEVGNYGSFGKIDGAESFQRLNPILLVGYSF